MDPFRSGPTPYRPLISHHPRLQRPMPSNTGMTIGRGRDGGIVSIDRREQMRLLAEGLGCVGDVTENVIRALVGHHPRHHSHHSCSWQLDALVIAKNTAPSRAPTPVAKRTTRCSSIPSPPASHHTHDALGPGEWGDRYMADARCQGSGMHRHNTWLHRQPRKARERTSTADASTLIILAVASGPSLRRGDGRNATLQTLRPTQRSVRRGATGNDVAEVEQQSIDRPSIVCHPYPVTRTGSEKVRPPMGEIKQRYADATAPHMHSTKRHNIPIACAQQCILRTRSPALFMPTHAIPVPPGVLSQRIKMLPALLPMHSCRDGSQTQPSCKPANRKAHRFQFMINQKLLQRI